jgi:phosphohistidine phosphatase
MKQLYIIRHAKSSWKNLSLDDFDRPLNKRGKRDAPFMGGVLKKNNILPDIIISSPALRAKKTAKIIAKELGYKSKIVFKNDLYHASTYILKHTLKSIENKHHIAFLFGHNPGLNMLVEEYIDFYDNIPTTGIIKIEFCCNKWEDIEPSNAQFALFDYPKRY